MSSATVPLLQGVGDFSHSAVHDDFGLESYAPVSYYNIYFVFSFVSFIYPMPRLCILILTYHMLSMSCPILSTRLLAFETAVASSCFYLLYKVQQYATLFSIPHGRTFLKLCDMRIVLFYIKVKGSRKSFPKINQQIICSIVTTEKYTP